MSDTLVKKYHEQLSYLRDAGQSFSVKHPKTASLLKLDKQGSADPFVERLLQSFAFLTAKVQANQEEGQNYLSRSLLNVLYPMASLMLPSVTTVQLKPNDNAQSATVLQKGVSFETDPNSKQNCSFRLGYDTQLMPLVIKECVLDTVLALPGNIVAPRSTKAFLRISIDKTHEAFTFNQGLPPSLRVYIKSFKQYTQLLISYLLQHQIGCIATTNKGDEIRQTAIKHKPLTTVGFDHESLLIPTEQSGYEDCQIFSEYAAYPEKHYYFDLQGFAQLVTDLYDTNLNIYIFLDDIQPEILTCIEKTEFCLGCAPIINLFESDAYPINIAQDINHYPLESTLPLTKGQYEIYKVNSCVVWQQGGDYVNAQPLYHEVLLGEQIESTVYWEAKQVACWEFGNTELKGTEQMLHINVPVTLNDRHFLKAHMLCTNRDEVLAHHWGNKINELQVKSDKDKNYDVEVLHMPTPPWRQAESTQMHHVLNMLIASHHDLFAINHDPKNVHRLKQLLNSLNRTKQEEVALMIESIQTVKTQRETQRYPLQKRLLYISGIKITLKVQLDSLHDGALYFFGCAFNALLKHYCHMNSCITLQIINQTTGKNISWPTQFA